MKTAQLDTSITEEGYPAVGQYVHCESPLETVVGRVTRTTGHYFYVEDVEGVVRVNPETVDWAIITKEECYEDA